jgi:hypothetical protein
VTLDLTDSTDPFERPAGTFTLNGTTNLAPGTVLNVRMLSNWTINEAGDRMALVNTNVVVVAGDPENTFSLIDHQAFAMWSSGGWTSGPLFGFSPDSYQVVVTGGGATGQGTVLPSPFVFLNFWRGVPDVGSSGYTVALAGATLEAPGTIVTFTGGASFGLPSGLSTQVVAGGGPPGYNSYSLEVPLNSGPPLGSYTVVHTIGSSSRTGVTKVNGPTINTVGLDCELVSPEPPSQEPPRNVCDFRLTGIHGIDWAPLDVTVTCKSGDCLQIPWAPFRSWMTNDWGLPSYSAGAFDRTWTEVQVDNIENNPPPTSGWPPGVYSVTVGKMWECTPTADNRCDFSYRPATTELEVEGDPWVLRRISISSATFGPSTGSTGYELNVVGGTTNLPNGTTILVGAWYYGNPIGAGSPCIANASCATDQWCSTDTGTCQPAGRWELYNEPIGTVSGGNFTATYSTETSWAPGEYQICAQSTSGGFACEVMTIPVP